MIKIIEEGHYKLLKAGQYTRILTLDKKWYEWIPANGTAEALAVLHKSRKKYSTLSMGRYRLYEVRDEPDLTDFTHLELLIRYGIWQGYLLPAGLPTAKSNHSKIISTKEIITKNTSDLLLSIRSQAFADFL